MSAQGIVGVSAVVATIVLLAVEVVILRFVWRRSSRVTRAVASGMTLLVLIASPICVDVLVQLLNRTGGATFVMIDPGWVVKIAPGVIAIVIAIVLTLRPRIRARTARRQNELSR